MNILIDTGILLDIGLKRKHSYIDSAKIVSLAENKSVIGFIAWHTLSTFY